MLGENLGRVYKLTYNGKNPPSADELNKATHLYLENVDSLEFLRGLKNVRSIEGVEKSRDKIVCDIEPIGTLENIEYINLYNTSVTGDINAINGLSKLREVILNNTSIGGDISTINGLDSLEVFDCQGTGIYGDIEPLGSFLNLNKILIDLTRHIRRC